MLMRSTSARKPSRELSKDKAGQLSKRWCRLSSVVEMKPATWVFLPMSTPRTTSHGATSGWLGDLAALQQTADRNTQGTAHGRQKKQRGDRLGDSSWLGHPASPRRLFHLCLSWASMRAQAPHALRQQPSNCRAEKRGSVSVPQPTLDKESGLQTLIRCTNTLPSLMVGVKLQEPSGSGLNTTAAPHLARQAVWCRRPSRSDSASRSVSAI